MEELGKSGTSTSFKVVTGRRGKAMCCYKLGDASAFD